MNKWAQRTIDLVTTQNYLDQLQQIYLHEDAEREVDNKALSVIKVLFDEKDETGLIAQLLDLKKFPYKDSYVGFLRKDRTAIERNPETVRRICDRLYEMGIDKLLEGVTQPKEANMRRGPQFANWVKKNFQIVNMDVFTKSTTGIVILGGTELEALNFCNNTVGIAVSKRPDIVAKVGKKYIVGEAKFLSSTGGNQGAAFEDGIKLATNSNGIAHKIFVLDGIHWIETGSSQYKRIESTQASIFSILLLKDFFEEFSRM